MTILAFWQGLIRYGIAMDLTMIGLQKLFGLQVSVPLGVLDMPFRSFTPEDLTWAFLAQSRVFVDIIGGFQILGSFLLLFHRTRLLGVFVLLPVMLNIVLLNFCYHFGWGESIQALELLIALLYLLLSEYDRLVEFFFRAASGMPTIRIDLPYTICMNSSYTIRTNSSYIKGTIRLSTLIIPLLLIWHYGLPDKNPWLTGKYKVGRLMVNAQNITANACGDSVLTTVYPDQGNDCVFEYNSQQRRLFGRYQLDETRSYITVIWHYPKYIHDTLFATLSTVGHDFGYDQIIFGKMGKDSVWIALVKMH